jgi:hypothetical protein
MESMLVTALAEREDDGAGGVRESVDMESLEKDLIGRPRDKGDVSKNAFIGQLKLQLGHGPKN